MSAFRLTLLPEPDSPRMVSVSPRASENDTPFTAATSMPRRRKRTVRSSTRNTGASTGIMSGMQHLLCMWQMAGDEMRAAVVGAIQRLRERRHEFRANCLCEGASGAEAAARRWIDRVGRIAGQRHFPGAAIGIERRLRGEQRAGIRM